MLRNVLMISIACFLSTQVLASSDLDFKDADVDIHDIEAQKRGFKLFLEYCQGLERRWVDRMHGAKKDLSGCRVHGQ